VETWTSEELAALAAQALGGARVGDGRVTGVPDPRLIRWYTTIGLLDRPTIAAGRVARYGPRHLLQLVAVKRLQAQGMPLAQVQTRLAGAVDDQLRLVADLPPGLTDGPSVTPARAADDDDRFWARCPAPARAPEVDATSDTVSRVHGLRLPGGVTLLLPIEPTPQAYDDIAAAVRPLLDALAAHGLLDPDKRSS
jgi:DNA-binding transcriptional MerR regulator